MWCGAPSGRGLPSFSATNRVAVFEVESAAAAAVSATVSTAARSAGRVQPTRDSRPRAARIADHVSWATTPTAVPRFTSATTPAGFAGIVFTVPPIVGQCTTAA